MAAVCARRPGCLRAAVDIAGRGRYQPASFRTREAFRGDLRVSRVIGSGPGGYVCAIARGQNGLKTVVIEKDPRVGGTCTCAGASPPSRLHSADVYEEARTALWWA